MDDQVAALQAIGARHPELDMQRVGIAGWSFGGYMAAMGVLLRPDVFKAAVAGAPVTDWKRYDTAYTERYMKTPPENPQGYADVYPVHRLDRGASGIVLFALDREAARAFADAWDGADKRYLAITRGHPPEAQTIAHAIPRAPGEYASRRSPRSAGSTRSDATRSSRRVRAPAGCTGSRAT